MSAGFHRIGRGRGRGVRPRTLTDVRHATPAHSPPPYDCWHPVPVTVPAPGTLGQLGEFALIDAITADLVHGPEVLVGPGDDAAVLDLEPPVVATVDVLVEGVHFRRDWSSARDVGRKAVAVNVADLEAMGVRASCLVVGFSAPASLEVSWALELAAGLAEEARTAGVSLVGGDVTAGQGHHDRGDGVGRPGRAYAGAPVRGHAGSGGGGLRPARLGRRRLGGARPRLPLAAGGRGRPPGAAGAVRQPGRPRRPRAPRP